MLGSRPFRLWINTSICNWNILFFFNFEFTVSSSHYDNILHKVFGVNPCAYTWNVNPLALSYQYLPQKEFLFMDGLASEAPSRFSPAGSFWPGQSCPNSALRSSSGVARLFLSGQNYENNPLGLGRSEKGKNHQAINRADESGWRGSPNTRKLSGKVWIYRSHCRSRSESHHDHETALYLIPSSDSSDHMLSL